jgi:hypothetical protein
MYLIREVVQCKPGKVRPMIEKFKRIADVMRESGYQPFRLMTDVTGERFWTLVAETTVEKIDDFFAMERQLMSHQTLATAMGDYHELVLEGRREIYRVEQ